MSMFNKPTSTATAPTANAVNNSTTTTPAAPAAPAAPIRLPTSSRLAVNYSGNKSTGVSDAVLDPFLNASRPFRLIAYGKPKTRKTWWTATGAAQLRTTILDGDTNTGILAQLPEAALTNTQVVPMNSIGNPTIFPTFIQCLKGDKYGRCFAFPINGGIPIRANTFSNAKIVKPQLTYVLVNLDALTIGDHLIIDSYTTLVTGVNQIYNLDRGIDPMKGEILDEDNANKFHYFRYHEAVMKEILTILRALPCNFTIVAHAHHYETEISQGKSRQRFGNIQPVSYSGTDGARLPALVGDVLYFEASPNSDKSTIIRSNSEPYRIGGCTHIPPGDFTFPGWDMSSFLTTAKLQYPTPDETDTRFGPWVTMLTGEEILDVYGGNKPS